LIQLQPQAREAVVRHVRTAIEVKSGTALITGSSRGIGRGIALKLAECGVTKIGVHYLRNEAAAREPARLLQERGAEAILIQADVTKPTDISRMFAEAREGLGSLGIFVANARPEVEHFYRFCQHSRQTWRQELDGELRLRCLDDGERSGGSTEVKQTTAVGGDVLVVVSLKAEEVAEFVIASAEPLRCIKDFEAAHTSNAAFHAAMILFQSIVLVSIGPMDNPPAER
jgi:hypothetical protein